MMSYLCFIKKYFINRNNTSNQFINFLTDCPCIPQTKEEKVKSWILAKLGWVDQLIGGGDHTNLFLFRQNPRILPFPLLFVGYVDSLLKVIVHSFGWN